MQISTATLADFEEILPYLDTAYGFAPGFFGERLASQWNMEGVDWSGVFVVRGEDHRINSLVRIWEMELIQDGRRVVCGGIGSVSTLKSARGQGSMSALMNHCVEEMTRRGYPIAILWGDRFRYAPFGFECGGRGVQFLVDARSLGRCGISPIASRDWDDDFVTEMERERVKIPYYRMRTHGELPRMYRTPTREILVSGEGEDFGWIVWDVHRIVEWGGKMETVLGLAADALQRGVSDKFSFALPDASFAPPALLRAMSGWSMSSESCRTAILDLPQTLETFGIDAPLNSLEGLDPRAQVWELFGRPDAPRNLWMFPIDTI